MPVFVNKPEFLLREKIAELDSGRVPYDKMPMGSVIDQRYTCYIDGLPLDWEDAEAGHMEAHALGGKTILSNCAMIRKSHNSAMGTMNVLEYKKIYEEKVAA